MYYLAISNNELIDYLNVLKSSRLGGNSTNYSAI